MTPFVLLFFCFVEFGFIIFRDILDCRLPPLRLRAEPSSFINAADQSQQEGEEKEGRAAAKVLWPTLNFLATFSPYAFLISSPQPLSKQFTAGQRKSSWQKKAELASGTGKTKT